MCTEIVKYGDCALNVRRVLVGLERVTSGPSWLFTISYPTRAHRMDGPIKKLEIPYQGFRS